MSWLDRLRGGFKKTADKVADNLTGITSRAALDTATLDDIEEALIASDLGPEASHRIREAIARQKFEKLDERGLRSILAEEIEKILTPVAKPLEIWGFPRPHVILVIGVNGSGKTTTIGKLGQWLKEQDYGVLLAAGDTFRAAAIEQLQIWGDRIGAPVISGKEGGDAAGIVFDGVKQATSQGIDVLVVDTAGRLQNKAHLMEELSKIRRVLGRQSRSAAGYPPRPRRDNRPERPCPSRSVPRDGGCDWPHHDQARRDGPWRRARRRGREIRPSHPCDWCRREGRRPPPVRSTRGRSGNCGTAAGMSTKAEPQGGAKLLIDLGPLLVFFLANFLAPVPQALRIFVATGAFMVAMVVAMIFSALKYQRISPLLWFSGVMVVILGGLTIWLHDRTFIQMKPTIYYALVSGLLIFGLLTDRPLLQRVLGSTYPGLDQAGWDKLTRNWAIFFAFMAILNESVWRNTSWDFWIGFKLWGAIPLTFLFAAANIPMLLKHGLMKEDATPAEPGPVE